MPNVVWFDEKDYDLEAILTNRDTIVWRFRVKLYGRKMVSDTKYTTHDAAYEAGKKWLKDRVYDEWAGCS